MFSSVLLPEPLGPTIARFSPASNASETSRSTTSGSPRVGNSLLTFSTSSFGILGGTLAVCPGPSLYDRLECFSGNPGFHGYLEARDFGDEFVGFGVVDEPSGVVADFVSLAAATVEIGSHWRDGLSHRQFQSGQRGVVRSLPFDPIAGAGDGHLRQEEPRLIGQAELVIRREAGGGNVAQVAIDRVLQVVQLLLGRDMRLNAGFGEQFLPGHPRFL